MGEGVSGKIGEESRHLEFLRKLRKSSTAAFLASYDDEINDWLSFVHDYIQTVGKDCTVPAQESVWHGQRHVRRDGRARNRQCDSTNLRIREGNLVQSPMVEMTAFPLENNGRCVGSPSETEGTTKAGRSGQQQYMSAGSGVLIFRWNPRLGPGAVGRGW